MYAKGRNLEFYLLHLKKSDEVSCKEIHEKMKENITGKSFLLRKRRKYEVKERLKNESSFPPE